MKDDLWIIVDQIEGTGTHNVRLQWLGGDFPYSVDPDFPASMNLATADGPFRVTVFNDGGQPAFGDVVAGQPDPPRGWLSRYYGEKTPVPSLAVEVNSPMPVTLVTVLGPHVPKVSASGNMWAVEAGGISAEFSIGSTGMIPSPIKVASHSR